jgi:hypothetical protein
LFGFAAKHSPLKLEGFPRCRKPSQAAGRPGMSFVPDAEQRLWRTVTRRKYQLTRDHVRLQNLMESLLEEAHIKLSSLVSDLLGASARRMLKALAEGGNQPGGSGRFGRSPCQEAEH